MVKNTWWLIWSHQLLWTATATRKINNNMFHEPCWKWMREFHQNWSSPVFKRKNSVWHGTLSPCMCVRFPNWLEGLILGRIGWVGWKIWVACWTLRSTHVTLETLIWQPLKALVGGLLHTEPCVLVRDLKGVGWLVGHSHRHPERSVGRANRCHCCRSVTHLSFSSPSYNYQQRPIIVF